MVGGGGSVVGAVSRALLLAAIGMGRLRARLGAWRSATHKADIDGLCYIEAA